MASTSLLPSPSAITAFLTPAQVQATPPLLCEIRDPLTQSIPKILLPWTTTLVQATNKVEAWPCLLPDSHTSSPALVEADAHWAVTVRSPDTRTSPRSEASIPGHLLVQL